MRHWRNTISGVSPNITTGRDEHGERDRDSDDEQRVERVPREVDEVERAAVTAERDGVRQQLEGLRRRFAGRPRRRAIRPTLCAASRKDYSSGPSRRTVRRVDLGARSLKELVPGTPVTSGAYPHEQTPRVR